MKQSIGVVLMAALLSACSGGKIKEEMPKYTVLEKQDAIELRSYPSLLVAEVTMQGKTRDDIANKSFWVLADFIFGENVTQESIAMTTPVTQTPSSEKIAMTAPVTQTQQGENWTTRFMMPSKYTKETLPKPKDSRIRILETAPVKTVSITFSGRWTDSNMMEHQEKLDAFVKARKLKTTGTPSYAFYNDPFTLPWNRRNEIIYTLVP